MAVVKKELRLVDRFSGVLKRYIDGLQDSIEKNEESERASRRWSNAMADAANKNIETAGTLRQTSDAAKLIGQTFDDAATRTYAASQVADAAKRSGWRWTEAAKTFNKDALLMEHSIDELANAGLMVQKRGAFERLRDMLHKVGRTARDSTIPGIDGLTKRLRGMALYLFTARRLLRYLREAAELAPDQVSKPWNTLTTSIKTGFNRAVVSVMAGMRDGLNDINNAMASDSGQKFARALETVGNVIGQLVGGALSMLAGAIEWAGEHAEQLAIILALLSAKFLLTAISSALANWQILLLVGVVVMLANILQSAGVTAADVFEYIGQGAGWLYAFGYNLVADTYNVLAAFGEFFANFLDEPVAACGRLIADLVNFCLGLLDTLARGIDALFGSNLSASVQGWIGKVQNWSDSKFGKGKITIDRMEKLDPATVMATWGDKGRNFGESLSDLSLKNAMATDIKMAGDIGNISKDTNSIAKAVGDEDLKAIIEMAERKFVSQVNLTAQTPVITINGANTGNSEADRRSLANTIRDILIEQVASGSTSTSAYARG